MDHRGPEDPSHIWLERPEIDTAANTILPNRLNFNKTDGVPIGQQGWNSTADNANKANDDRAGHDTTGSNFIVNVATKTFLHGLHQEFNIRYAEHFPFHVRHSSIVTKHELAGHLTSEMLAQQISTIIDPHRRRSSQDSSSSRHPSNKDPPTQTSDIGIRQRRLHNPFRSSLPATKNQQLPCFKVELYFGFKH